MGRVSVRDKLFLFTTLSGALFISTQLECATLDFRQLIASSAFPIAATPSFQDQRGFFNVLRWAESLHTSQELDVLVRMVKESTMAGAANTEAEAAKSHKTIANEADREGNTSSSRATGSSITGAHKKPHDDVPFHVQLAEIASFETYVHLSKASLQCGLVLFLYRLQMLSRRRAMSTICLCALVLLCWKMAQTCLQEILASRKPHKAPSSSAPSSSEKESHAMEMKAAFLSTLFLLRFAGTMLVNFVIGRAYQLYFCPSWPETWRRVPKYLGSKNLIMATLFYASGCVAAMSVSCTALRSLSEAALQFESAALTCALLHFVVFRFAAQSKSKQAR